MNVYQKISIEILKCLDEMDNNEEFKKKNPNITATEYLITKVKPNIKLCRIINILTGNAKRISLKELSIICYWLDIELSDMLKRVI